MRRLPGSHEPNNKNRSSKHLGWLAKMKPAIRSLSTESLNAMVGKDVQKELARRRDKKAKKDMK